jgi:hypothetical protein
MVEPTKRNIPKTRKGKAPIVRKCWRDPIPQAVAAKGQA